MDAPCSKPTPSPINYHPSFTSSTADVTLSSSDGLHYRLPSYTLRTTSGLFNTLLSLPRGGDRSCAIVIPTNEPSDALTTFLFLLTGRGLPPSGVSESSSSSSFGAITRLVGLAEKWDAPGPLSYIRAGLTSAHLLRSDPLGVFQIACHFEWLPERHLAARHTLLIDLLTGELLHPESGSVDDVAERNQRTLQRLSSKDLMFLFRLRRLRRDKFREIITSTVHFAAGNSDNYFCSRCGVTRIDNRTWKAFRARLIAEIDQYPLGDTITGREVGGIGGTPGLDARYWPEALHCWEAECTGDGCGGKNYGKEATLEQIRRCIDSLPFEIDDQ
ncbi:hypothetical protein V5O48_010516 [Marasmius crinis-equi]|uniref:BTB domain-containing protein n=1 Tax=Marasmius crinis-equi TaxID=585013 RepID=A0ABR3F863_9AGAR